MNNRRAFLDFVQGLLNLNPLERWSPWQAIQHPFITGETFTQPYSMVLKMARMAQTVPLAMSPGESIPAQGAAPIKSHISNVKFRRPRANTISSSKVQNVPPQLQRLVAMQQAHSSSRGPYHSGDRMNDASHSLDGMQEIPPSAIRKLSPQDPGTSSNSQVGARRLTPHDTSPLQRRKTNPNPHAPPQFGSKSSVNGSSPNTNDQLSSRGLNASDTQSSGSRVSSGDPFAEKRPLDPTSVAYQGYESQGAYGVQRSLSQNPMNQDVSQRFPQGASWSSSYTSFDQMSPYEMNSRHGPTGERPGLPSRIPSTATSAEWEMFDDLDNQNRSYAVSPNISVVGSQRSSRRSSMMDMPVDYGSSYHDAGTPSITPDQVYSNSYNPHSYMGRSPQYSGPFGQHQMAQAQQQQQSYPMHLDSHESNQRMSRRYSSRSTISIEQGGRLSEVGGMPPGVPGGVQPGFEDECRDQMNDMPFRQGPQAIPIANSQHSSPRGSLSAQGAYGSPRGSVYRSNSGSRRYSSGPNPQNQQSLSGEVNAQDIYVNPGADPFPVEQQYGYMPYIPPLDAKRHSVSVQPYSGAPEDPPGFQQHASNRRPRRATQHDTRPAPPYGTMPYSGSDQHHGQVPYHHIPENPFVNSHNPYQPHPGMATTSMPESVDHPHSFQYANNRRHSDAPTRGNSQLGREQFTADEFGAHPSDSQASNMDAYSTEQRN